MKRNSKRDQKRRTFKYQKTLFKSLLLIVLLIFLFPASGEIGSESKFKFEKAVFCTDVSPSGEPVNISTNFSSNTPTVYLYLSYSGMRSGDNWGMYWTLNNDLYSDERDQLWNMGPDGWVLFDVTNDGILYEGNWNVEIYHNRNLVQTASFTVIDQKSPDDNNLIKEASDGGFGKIRFSTDVTEENIPIHQDFEFEYGLDKIAATFPYYMMNDGIPWTREWLLNGEEFLITDDIWEDGEEGIKSISISYEDDTILDSGIYTLNLYIENQIARSASVSILPPEEYQEEIHNPSPEELIDEELLPAWQMLAESPTEVVRDMAQFALDNEINILLVDDGDAIAWYRYEKGSAELGDIYVKRSNYDKYSWVEVASAIAHELTHAVQHKADGENIHCSVENEYYAYIVELYVLMDNGRKDLIYENWSGLFDDSWKFNTDKLWYAVKDAYDTCPDY